MKNSHTQYLAQSKKKKKNESVKGIKATPRSREKSLDS